jgi:hypothetical protein
MLIPALLSINLAIPLLVKVDNGSPLGPEMTLYNARDVYLTLLGGYLEKQRQNEPGSMSKDNLSDSI